MDFIVEKAAELGVTELWPMLCERSVVRDAGLRAHGQMATARDAPRPSKASRPATFRTSQARAIHGLD